MKKDQLDPALQELAAEIEEISARVTGLIQFSEKSELSASQIDALYRDVHTLKGSCLLFGYNDMGALAHELETRMEPVRKGKEQLKTVGVDRLLKAFDLFTEFCRNHMADPNPQFNQKVQDMTSSFKNGTAVAAPPNSQPIAVAAPASSPAPVSSPTPQPYASAPAASADEANTTVRVPVALLDNLMTMMSEMVLVRNQVLQISNNSDDLEFLNLSQRLDVVTSELQSEVMKTRMQPIGNVLSKFQRVVRDLAKELNKKIELTLEGTETELDKSLIEAIKDPLTHIIRNACDHGLETTDERKASGKSEVGQILVRSFHEGGQVIIQVTDNGRGLNRDKLIKKALEKGIISQEKASKMTDREAHELIFAAGFSTAANVTNISGRGVGMDVVKNNIEKIGGRVELKSELGKGMTLSLKIPLTLAIVPAMIIRSGQEKYAIPQVKLVELVRVENNDSDNQKEKIEYIQGKPVYRLRGKLLPLVILGEVLNPDLNKDQASYNIVVLNADNRFFGLVVDEIHDTADIVVKPLSRFLKNLSVYSGATVLGDGSVSLILDVIGLAKHAQLTAARPQEDEVNNQNRDVASDLQEFLFCKVGAPTVHGIPLAVVHRLEEFQWADIQMSGEIPVVQYREQLLPIMSVHEYLGYGKFDIVNLSQTYPTCKTVVVKKNTKLYALQVDQILDVISTSTNIDDAFSDRKGVLGSLLVNGEVSVIINAYDCVDHLITKMSPAQASERISNFVTINENKKPSQKHFNPKNVNILLAEDSNFFKRHLVAILKKNGFNVTVGNNGAEAFELLSQGQFDLILSDIEMPVMNGLEFAKAVRAQDIYKDIPMIAITTKFSEAYAQEGLEAGFNEYLEKIKETELVETIFHYLNSVHQTKPQKGNVAV